MSPFVCFLNWATSVSCLRWMFWAPNLTMFYYLLLRPICYSTLILLLFTSSINSLIQNEKLREHSLSLKHTEHTLLFTDTYLWARGASKAGGECRSLLTRFTISPARLGSKLPKDKAFSIWDTWASRSSETLLVLTTVLEKKQKTKSCYAMHDAKGISEDKQTPWCGQLIPGYSSKRRRYIYLEDLVVIFHSILFYNSSKWEIIQMSMNWKMDELWCVHSGTLFSDKKKLLPMLSTTGWFSSCPIHYVNWKLSKLKRIHPI